MAVEVYFALVAKVHGACDAGEERVVAPDADVFARHNLRAALTDDYLADRDFLPVSAFDAEILRI